MHTWQIVRHSMNMHFSMNFSGVIMTALHSVYMVTATSPVYNAYTVEVVQC